MILPIEATLPPLVVDTDGAVKVGKTRVTLDTVVSAFNDGATAEEIAQQYPSLDLGDVYAAIGYYLQHRVEVEVYLKERQQQAKQIRQQNETRFEPTGIRERLLARRVSK